MTTEINLDTDVRFDLSKVTAGEMANVDPSGELKKLIEFIDKATPDLDVYELPLNLLPVLINRFITFMQSYMNPNTSLDVLKNLLDEDDED